MGNKVLVEGLDYYLEEKDGTKFKVFTEHYLSNRGFCCKNSCRHCPYGFNKNKKMKPTSLESFKSIMDAQYPEIKKYIISENEHHIIIEDPMGDMIFGSNKDLSALFDTPCKFPIENISTRYKERDGCFVITIDLK